MKQITRLFSMGVSLVAMTALSAGATTWLSRPVVEHDLVKAVREVLTAEAPPPAD